MYKQLGTDWQYSAMQTRNADAKTVPVIAMLVTKTTRPATTKE
jgi:hypothetical protein